MDLEELLKNGYEEKASDIHFMPGRPVMFRINGNMSIYGKENVAEAEMEELLDIFLTEIQRKILEQDGAIETAVTVFDQFRIRVNAFRQQESYAVTVRLFALKIPDPEEILLPSGFLALTREKKGLIIIAGGAGTGKTTTAASLLHYIASTETKHIITIEDPVEYVIPHGKGMVSQREIGSNEEEDARAVSAAVRQNADVIFIGNLKGTQMISEAVRAAESGCLVIAVLHTLWAEDAVQRIIDSFLNFKRPEMQRRLSGVLKGIVVQQLLPSRSQEGRCAVYELLLEDKDISMMIREGRISQITDVMEQKRESGMQTMDDAVLSAYMKSAISAETALSFAFDRKVMEQRMKIY